MNVKEICRRGYFDRLVVDGYMMPMYNNKGIEIKQGMSLVDALEDNKQAYNQGIGKLRLNIAGESLNTDPYEEILKMREHRENDLGLKRQKIGTVDRYIIGYVDLLILKSDYSFPDEVKNKGKTKDDISKLAKGEDELQLMLNALELQHNIIVDDNGIDDCNIAILDKIFIDKSFRECEISSWVHNNIAYIAKIYGMLDIAAVLLVPGDFTNAAQTEFNMTNKDYINMLVRHYKKHGYKFITDNVMCKKLIKKSKKYFIGFNN